jgi:hypothetical protein
VPILRIHNELEVILISPKCADLMICFQILLNGQESKRCFSTGFMIEIVLSNGYSLLISLSIRLQKALI